MDFSFFSWKFFSYLINSTFLWGGQFGRDLTWLFSELKTDSALMDHSYWSQLTIQGARGQILFIFLTVSILIAVLSLHSYEFHFYETNHCLQIIWNFFGVISKKATLLFINHTYCWGTKIHMHFPINLCWHFSRTQLDSL